MPSFSIIVPALNEERNLGAAVRDITHFFGQLGVDYEILVFNDHSADGTGKVADDLASRDPRIRIFHNPKRLNIGGIFKAGLREARCEYCLLIPGDNETAVSEVVHGLRYLDQVGLVVSYTANQEIRPPVRRLLSRTYTWVINWLFGTDFTYTNGSSIYRTEFLRRIQIKTDGFSYQTEALVKLVLQGVDFVEFGIHIRERVYGKSTALRFGNWLRVIQSIGTLFLDVRVFNPRRYGRLGRKLNTISPSPTCAFEYRP